MGYWLFLVHHRKQPIPVSLIILIEFEKLELAN